MSALHDDLRNFIGTTQYYQNPMFASPLYTDGIRHLLLNGANGRGCFWLFTLIATEPAIRKQAEEFASIKFIVADNKAHIIVDDGNGSKPVFDTVVNTDMEEGTVTMYWTDGVLLLSGEY